MRRTTRPLIPVIITVIFTAVLVLPICGLLYCDLISKIPSLPANFTVTAHTGCENTPPNSLESIIAGVESGASAVEFDIRFLNDGTPVLCHDEDEKSEESVKLEDAFNLLLNYSCKINLDLKETKRVDKVAALVKLYNLGERCYFSGVTEDKVQEVKSLAPDIAFYLNIKLSLAQKSDRSYIEKIGQSAKNLGAVGVNLRHTGATRQSVSVWRSQGLLVSVYTVNADFDIHSTLYKNVDNITTLKPTRVCSLIKGY